jgi:SAM-dependent methyltransferase
MRQGLRRLALSRYEGYPPGPQEGVQRALAPLGKALLDWQGDSMTRLPWVGEGRLLDYGCGSGWYAARMRQLGWHVTAMDFNPESLAEIAARYRLPTIAGTLPHPKVRPGSFDAITMGCVLEHLPDPHQVMEAAVEALAPGGLLVIVVPSINSLGFRAFGADWPGLDLPRHLLHFSPASLRKLASMHGLEVREVRSVARPSWLRRGMHASGRRAGVSLARRLLSRAGAWGPVVRLLGQWSAQTRQGDVIRLVATRPSAATLTLPLAA